MNIVIVEEMTGIHVYKTWSQVKKYTSFNKEDFTKYGSDYILNTSNESFEISKDIKLLEHVAAQKMFTKNKLTGIDLVSVITLGLVFIGLVM